MTWYRENRYVVVGLLGVAFIVIALGTQVTHIGTDYDRGFFYGIGLSLMLTRWVLRAEWEARKKAEVSRDFFAQRAHPSARAVFHVTRGGYPRGDA